MSEASTNVQLSVVPMEDNLEVDHDVETNKGEFSSSSVAIKNEFDANSQMLELPSNENDSNSFDLCNTLDVETKDRELMEMSPNGDNGDKLNRFSGTEEERIDQGEICFIV